MFSSDYDIAVDAMAGSGKSPGPEQAAEKHAMARGSFPQGLKPIHFIGFFGMAEAKP
jgi:hypothetical protein